MNLNVVTRVFGAILVAGAVAIAAAQVSHADDAKPAEAAPAPTPTPTPTPKPLIEKVRSNPRGALKNPYSPSDAAIVDQGHKLFMRYGCSGCHGGSGGGGMCPQLNGEVWFYGIDDDILFRLVTLGSVELMETGAPRLGGAGLQMPPFGDIIKSEDDFWKILTWIRSVYKGDPKKKFW